MVEEQQRRFRRRGGAKKKKKPHQLPANSQPTDQPYPPPSEQTSHSKPYFQNANNSYHSMSQDLHSTLDSDLQTYLQKLQQDLYSLDPTGEISYNFAPLEQDDPPAPVLLARNSLRELTPRIQELARDNSASRLLETLFNSARDTQTIAFVLETILSLGASRMAALALHHCASHVLENIIRLVRADLQLPVLSELATLVAEWTPTEILDLMQSSSGSHAFRVIISTMAGLPEDEPREAKLDDANPSKIRRYVDYMAVDVPKEWHTSVCALATTLLDTDEKVDLPSLLWRPASCTALQALLSAISTSDKALAKRLAQAAINDGLDELMHNACGSRFVERAVLCLGAEFVNSSVKGRLKELAQDSRANFCVQRILLGLKGRGPVMNAWDELEESIPHMLGFGKTREGVVLSLLRVTEAEGDENCRKRASRCIARACGAVGNSAKALAGVLIMGSTDSWNAWKENIENVGRGGLGCHGRPDDALQLPRTIMRPSLLGTLMARCIMRFPGGPGQGIRDSMATLTDLEILALTADTSGSRLIEQWIDIDPPSNGGRTAAKIMTAIGGENESAGISAASRSPYGAQVIVKCSHVLPTAHRRRVITTLASDLDGLKKHPHGQMVVRKCRVEQFIRSGDQWENAESAKETKQRMFADILEDDGEEDVPKRKPKKEKKRKRKEQGFGSDEIADVLSSAAPGDGKLTESTSPTKNGNNDEMGDSGLGLILGAIGKAADSEQKGKKKKRKKRSG